MESSVDAIWIALVSGFIATAVLSLMMLVKQAMRVMPEMDMIGMISGMMHSSRAMGWVVHFVVGTVLYGLAFLWVFAGLWGNSYWLSGLTLGAVGWIIAMVMMMPMAGNGFFGLKLGPMVPVMSLVMHLVFGAILGWSYGALIS